MTSVDPGVRPPVTAPDPANAAAPAASAALTARAQQRATAQRRVRWELLVNLVRKDLKIKYQGSALGFAWSLANPLLLLAVYSFVFQVVFRGPGTIPYFGIYLMSGLLVWNAFAGSVSFASGSVLGASNLVKKVRFPLMVLPLSSVGFAAVHFVLQMGVLLVVMVVIGYSFVGLNLLLAIPAILVAAVFTVGLSLLVSALEVRYRDTQHLLDVALIAWFWVNPIVYGCGLIKTHLRAHYWLYFLNPMASVVAAFQRAIYAHPFYEAPGPTGKPVRTLVLADDGYSFYLTHLAISGLMSLALLAFAAWVFRRMQPNFVEDM